MVPQQRAQTYICPYEGMIKSWAYRSSPTQYIQSPLGETHAPTKSPPSRFPDDRLFTTCSTLKFVRKPLALQLSDTYYSTTYEINSTMLIQVCKNISSTFSSTQVCCFKVIISPAEQAKGILNHPVWDKNGKQVKNWGWIEKQTWPCRVIT